MKEFWVVFLWIALSGDHNLGSKPSECPPWNEHSPTFGYIIFREGKCHPKILLVILELLNHHLPREFSGVYDSMFYWGRVISIAYYTQDIGHSRNINMSIAVVLNDFFKGPCIKTTVDSEG